MFRQFFRNLISSQKILFFWFFSAILAGAAGSLTVYIFLRMYELLYSFFIYKLNIPYFLLPAAGALLVGLLVYRVEPQAMGEGIPSYLQSLKERNGYIPFRETFFKFWAALLTLSSAGNGGFIGPVGRISAGFMSTVGNFFSGRIMKRSYLHLYTICGLSAAIGALLNSPVGAGLFAVEIIQKTNMRYKDLFPSILASSSSVFFARLTGIKPIVNFPVIHDHINYTATGWILLIAVLGGIAGYGFIVLYETVSKILHRNHKRALYIIILKIVAGSLAASLVATLVNPSVAGTSTGIFEALFNNDHPILYGRLPVTVPLFIVLILLILSKALASCLTIGSGLNAGFTGPAMLIGLLLGASVASIAGIEPNTIEYYAFLAAGFAGMLSSTMNTPIASAVITLELFGFAYSLPAGVAAIIGFQVNRSNTLYDFAVRERMNEYEEGPEN